MVAEIMDTDDFDETTFLEQVDHITADPGETITLHFRDGRTAEYKGDTLNRSAACGRAGSHGRKAQGRCLRPRFYGQGRAVHQLRGADRLLHQLHQEPP